MFDIVLILVLAGLVMYWWHGSRCKEIALQHCQRICAAADVQLLDNTVSQQKLWLRRNANSGHIELCRLYTFEYYAGDEARHYGYIAMLGRQIVDQSLQSMRAQTED